MKRYLKYSAFLLFFLDCRSFLSAQTIPTDSKIFTVRGKHATLEGTLLTVPAAGKSTLVLIISGSGPTDRDGNSTLLPGKNNSLLQLAEGLAASGISSFRYDKRAIGKSVLDPGITEDSILFSDMVNDAELFYESFHRSGYKEIYIAGHSEGSLVGLVLAAKVNPAGFISIAGAGRPASEVLKEQLSSLPEKLKTECFASIDSLQAGFTVRKINPGLYSLFRPSVQPYMKSWLSYDPRKILHELSCPVLILQGTKDIQVKESDARALQAAHPEAKLVLINDMNHVLKEVVSTDRNENIKTYSNPDLPVMKELTTEIVNFIRKKNSD